MSDESRPAGGESSSPPFVENRADGEGVSERNEETFASCSPSVSALPNRTGNSLLLADVIGLFVGSQSLQNAGWWALLGAAIGAALSLIAGLFDMTREKIEPAAQKRVHTHMKVGLTLVRGLSRVNRVALADLFEPRLWDWLDLSGTQ